MSTDYRGDAPTIWDFDGDTYEPVRDRIRLSRELLLVRQTMFDGEWHTLAELAAITGGSEAGVSARLRDLRKKRFGGWVIQREYVHNGLWRYRLVVRP